MREKIEQIDRLMSPVLSDAQAVELHAVLVACLTSEGKSAGLQGSTTEYIELFLKVPRSWKDARIGHCATTGVRLRVLRRV